jgi:hypothetical protein
MYHRHRYLHMTNQNIDQDIRYQVVVQVQQTTTYLILFSFYHLTNIENKWLIEQYDQSL